MKAPIRRLIWLLVLSGTLGAILVFFSFSPLIKDAYGKPDKAQMRAYRVSKLTDAQLIALHNRSVQEFEEHKKRQAEDGAKYLVDRAKRQQECEANPASKLRNPTGCFEPLPLGYEDIGKPAMGWDSPDRFFEDYIMGICGMIDTVREAKRIGCLPP